MTKTHDYFYGEIDSDCIVMEGGQVDGLVVKPRELILGEETFVQFTHGSVGKYVFEGKKDKFGRRLMELKGVEER